MEFHLKKQPNLINIFYIFYLKGIQADFYEFWVDDTNIGFISDKNIPVLKDFPNVLIIEDKKYNSFIFNSVSF